MAGKKKDRPKPAKSKPGKSAPLKLASPPPPPPSPDADAPPAQPEQRGSGIPVVGIGASAGGLDAFKRFFTAMPPKSGIAFVLIPHLDPKHESMMVELLTRYTPMPVSEAVDGVQVEADHVYVIPPNCYMTICAGALRLTRPPLTGAIQISIDPFLRSLAEDKGERAICIIASGTGSHGSLGLKAIKAAGGMTMVQDPATAEQPRMPQSAIATGMADYVLPIDKMPEALLKYVRHSYVDGGRKAEKALDASDDLNQILALLRTRTRFDFRCYRKKMLVRRVERRMGLNHFEELSAYLAYLRQNPPEVKHLVRDLLISVTSFFRDPEALEILAKEAIEPLVRGKDADSSLRVWVPGCATGEEAYTITMLILDRLARAQKTCRLQVFATDVDEDALEVARLGIYPESISADVAAERLSRFFTPLEDSAYQINKQVRECIVFAPQNLVLDAPFSKLDLISCRNILIYLEPEVQKKVIALFHFGLIPGGYLLLGPSETVGRHTQLFEPVSKKWRIFRRIGPVRADRVEFPIATPGESVEPGRRALESPPRAPGVAELTQRLLLEELAPAAVLINRRFEILYFIGPTTQYLDVPTGEPTKDLLSMAKDGLRVKLRSAIHKAMEQWQPVQLTDVQVRRDGRYVPIVVTIKPASQRRKEEAGDSDRDGLFLVLFQDAASVKPAPHPAPHAVDEGTVVRQLEYELRATKEDLQSSVEELESSNEELKASNEEVMSMNEELQSANEELETSKEEMQTLNEELSTVNNQLQEKVQELEDASNDMANLLNCTDIAIVFLDTRLHIRRFTASAVRLMYLVETDVGRAINEIRLKFADPELQTDAAEVLRQLAPREKQVQAEDGRWYIRRITLFRTVNNRIEGAIVSFIDVSLLKETGVKFQLLATILLNSSDAIIVHSLDGQITDWNKAAEKLYGYGEAEALQLNIHRLVPDNLQGELGRVCERLKRGEQVGAFETQRITKDGRVLDVWVSAIALTDDAGKPVAIAKVDRDITERKRAHAHLEEEVQRRTAMLRESEALLRAVLNAPDDAIITITSAGLIHSVNPAAERMFGYSAPEMVGKDVSMLLSKAFRGAHGRFPRKHHTTGAAVVHGIPREIEARRKNGSTFPVEWSVGEVENLGLFTGVLRDISRRKELEREVVRIATLEQQRIGQDLHDECGQQLTALGLLLNGLTEMIKDPPPAVAEMIQKIAHRLQEVSHHVHSIAQGLALVGVKNSDFHGALEELVARLGQATQIHCTYHADEGTAVDSDAEATQLFHIAQEACTNAVKHADAKELAVRLLARDNAVILEIRDDGRGVGDEPGDGLGLRIMRNRAAVIGADFSIRPAQPTGTIITCALRKDRQS